MSKDNKIVITAGAFEADSRACTMTALSGYLIPRHSPLQQVYVNRRITIGGWVTCWIWGNSVDDADLIEVIW